MSGIYTTPCAVCSRRPPRTEPSLADCLAESRFDPDFALQKCSDSHSLLNHLPAQRNGWIALRLTASTLRAYVLLNWPSVLYASITALSASANTSTGKHIKNCSMSVQGNLKPKAICGTRGGLDASEQRRGQYNGGCWKIMLEAKSPDGRPCTNGHSFPVFCRPCVEVSPGDAERAGLPYG